MSTGILDTVAHLPCHPKNRGGTRRAETIRYLVYHYTGNEGDRAANNARYYRSTVVQASAHYFVDDEEVWQSVEDLETAWAVGGSKWSDCGKTGGGRLYGTVTNSNSISIEMCGTRRNGQRMASEATLSRAAKLGQELMAKYRIPIERVVRHFDVTGKHCPAYLMNEAAWKAFQERLTKKEEETMTQEQFDAMLENWLKRQREKPLPHWAEKEFQEAVRLGLTDGTEPMAFIPRYQAALLAKRAAKRPG